MKVNRLIVLDREDISYTEKKLFAEDLKKVANEHFECDGDMGVDVTKTENGFSVCVIFGARRIKNSRPVT